MNRVFRVGAVIQISITAVESKVDTALTASYARITDATPEAAIERKEAGAEKTGVNRFINDNLGHSAQCTADPTCMDQGVGAALSGRNADPHDSARRNIRASTLWPVHQMVRRSRQIRQKSSRESKMRDFSSAKRNARRSAVVAASLTLAASVAAIGTAHAAVKVTVTGTVSCAKFDESSTPKTVTITPKKGNPDSDEPPGEQQVEKYTVKLTGIPNNGTTATAKVVCEDDDGDTNTYKVKKIPIKKPTTGAPVTLNLPA